MPKRVIAYARVSTKEQDDDGTSLDTQLAAMEVWCTERGHILLEDHRLREDYTGYELERPKLDQVRSLVRSGKVDIVLCYALDRLSRKQVHQTVLYYEFQQEGVEVELVSETLDSTPEGQFLRAALGFVAEKEREKLRERTQRGARERARRGYIHPAGLPIYGYKWAGDKKEIYVVDEAVSWVVALIFEASAGEGKTNRAIADMLNERRIATRMAHFHTLGIGLGRTASTHWTPDHISEILRDPCYKGMKNAFEYTVVKDRYKDARGKLTTTRSVKRNIKPENEIPLPATTIPVIVAEDVWQRAQNVRERHKHVRRSRGSLGGIALLRGGLATCGQCGGNMSISSYRNKKDRELVTYYHCKPRVNIPCPGSAYPAAKLLDEAIWADLTDMVANSDEIVRAYQQMLSVKEVTHERDDATVTAIKRALDREKIRQANYLVAIGEEDNKDVRDALRVSLSETMKRIGTLETELKRVESVVEVHHDFEERLLTVAQYLERAASTMHHATFDERRAFMFALGVKVKCYRTADVLPDGKAYEIILNFGRPLVRESATGCGYDPCDEPMIPLRTLLEAVLATRQADRAQMLQLAQ